MVTHKLLPDFLLPVKVQLNFLEHCLTENYWECLSFVLGNFVLVFMFYFAWHWYNSTLPSKSSWVQASPLSPPHLCLQLVDVSPQVLHNGQQEVERAVLPFLASTSRFSPPAPGSSLSRSSRGANCSSFTSTVLASAALLLMDCSKKFQLKRCIWKSCKFWQQETHSYTHLGAPPPSLSQLNIGV